MPKTNEGCNSCASLARVVLSFIVCFIACFILPVIAPPLPSENTQKASGYGSIITVFTRRGKSQ